MNKDMIFLFLFLFCFLGVSGFSWQRRSQGSRTPSGRVYQRKLHLERNHKGIRGQLLSRPRGPRAEAAAPLTLCSFPAQPRGQVRVHDHLVPLLQRTHPLQRTGAPQRARVPGEDAQLQILQGTVSLQKHQGWKCRSCLIEEADLVRFLILGVFKWIFSLGTWWDLSQVPDDLWRLCKKENPQRKGTCTENASSQTLPPPSLSDLNTSCPVLFFSMWITSSSAANSGRRVDFTL